MPSQRLNRDTIQVSKFDIAGCDSANGRFFIRHVGLFEHSHQSFNSDGSASLVHMGPPLESTSGAVKIQVVGTLPLSEDETRQIGAFIDDVQNEYEAAGLSGLSQYTIRHLVDAVRDNDGSVVYRKYSCVGFVVAAYSEAGIELLDRNEEELPPVSLETLLKAYPDQKNALENPRLRERFGLSGEASWPIMLAGYVFHSLNRAQSEIRSVPYTPKAGDELFPRIS
jgi:hypothetical protein